MAVREWPETPQAGRYLYDSLAGCMVGARCNPHGYLFSRCFPRTRHIKQREEPKVFIFNDVVDLFALFGFVHLARVLSKRRHKVS